MEGSSDDPPGSTTIEDAKIIDAPDPPKKRGRGRPRFEPTELHRNQVTLLASEGNTTEVIAAVIGIDHVTLRKYFWMEIQRGLDLGRAKNTRRFHKAADAGNVSAMIWLDKTRYGVREHEDTPVAPGIEGERWMGKKERLEHDAKTAHVGTIWDGVLQ